MSVFQFKHFSISQANSAMKVGTDSMLLGSSIYAVKPKRILDVGAGTGVLSLMMAQRFPDAMITGVEIDENAVKDCFLNVEKSDWSNRIIVQKVNFLDFEAFEKFDLIISNPPFFDNSLKSSNEGRNTARHTDTLPFDALLRKISTLLAESGVFWVILPIEEAEKMFFYAEVHGLYPRRIIEIFGKPEKLTRKIIQFMFNNDGHVIKESFTVRDKQGLYTDQYKSLTREFHDRSL